VRRIALVFPLATTLIAAGSLAQRPGDVTDTYASQRTGAPAEASARPVSAPVPSPMPSLPNQFGEEIPVGVQSPPPPPSPGVGPAVSETTTRMHMIRNGRVWTVEVPALRTADGGISTVPDANEIVNSQLPVMRRCGGEVQSGCWPFSSDPPGNPDIPDRP
jgi:hypothetical protein